MNDYPAVITIADHVEPVPRRVRAFLIHPTRKPWPTRDGQGPLPHAQLISILRSAPGSEKTQGPVG